MPFELLGLKQISCANLMQMGCFTGCLTDALQNVALGLSRVVEEHGAHITLGPILAKGNF